MRDPTQANGYCRPWGIREAEERTLWHVFGAQLRPRSTCT